MHISLSVVLYLAIICAISATDFDWVKGNITIYLSQVAYCENYYDRTYSGPAEGFVVTQDFFTDKDVQGFIGYNPKQKTIYVFFRGSSYMQNWISNINIIATSCPEQWGVDGCELHKGFWNAAKTSYPTVKEAVDSLRAKYPDYGVLVGGHSLGAALSTLTAVQLKNDGISNIEVFNYGSPRPGNKEFADYVTNGFMKLQRVVHYQDMVPHLPTSVRFSHSATEWYENPVHTFDPTLNPCQGEEDKECSYQWSGMNLSIDDHLLYLGRGLGQSKGCEWLDDFYGT